MNLRSQYLICVIVVCVSYISVVYGQTNTEPFARKRLERAILIEDVYCYTINLRLDVDDSFRYYVTKIRRNDPDGEREYSDMPTPGIDKRGVNLSSVYVLDDRIYAIAPGGMSIPPYDTYVFHLHHYPFFVSGRYTRGLVPTGGKNERGEIVHRTPGQEKELNRKIADAMRRGQSPMKLYDGFLSVLFHDVRLYDSIRDPTGFTRPTTAAIAFTPRDRDSGAVAAVTKNGQIVYFEYQYEKGVFNLSKDHVQVVGEVESPAPNIYLTAEGRIVVKAEAGLVQFTRSSSGWQKSTLRTPFKVIGRIWDRTKEKIFCSDLRLMGH